MVGAVRSATATYALTPLPSLTCRALLAVRHLLVYRGTHKHC